MSLFLFRLAATQSFDINPGVAIWSTYKTIGARFDDTQTEVLLDISRVIDLQHVRDANSFKRQGIGLPMWVAGGRRRCQFDEWSERQVRHLGIRTAERAVVKTWN